MNLNVQELNDRLGMPGLRFSSGPGGLTRAFVETPVAKGELYLQGAHVTQYQPTGHAPVLWMSRESYFEVGKPIRGGVPICFPWFGANPKAPQSPAHGLARITEWAVIASGRLADGGVAIELATDIDGWLLRYRVEFGRTLELSLSVEWEQASKSLGLSTPRAGEAVSGSREARESLPSGDDDRRVSQIKNRSDGTWEGSPRVFEEALHTYLVVGDIRQATIEGLEACGYLDKVGGTQKYAATHEAIRFSQETDRIYLETNTVCTLRDPVLKRSISIRQANSRSTIVWNPWIDKSARMPDFGNDEWPGMVCIETANVGAQGIAMEPGQLHTIVARIDVM